MAWAPSLSPLDQWLKYVDGQLDENEGVAYLKLALHSEIPQGKLASIETPSHLFRELQERHGKEAALPKYHRALLSVGGKLRGKMCVNNAKEIYGLDLPPPTSIQHQSKEFQFYQCLTRIGRVLRGQEEEKRLLIYFSRKEYLNTNYRNIHGLPDLFVRLCNARIITQDDTKNLQTFLEQYDVDEAQRHLHAYRGSVLGKIDEDSSDPPSALPSSASRPRSRQAQLVSAAPQRLNINSSNKAMTTVDQMSSAPPEELYNHPLGTAMATGDGRGNHRPLTVSTESQTDSNIIEQMETESTTGNKFQCKRACLCCLLLLLALLFLLALGVLSLFSQYLWQPLYSAEANSHPWPTLQRQGETVVLSEMKEIIVKEVVVQELVYGTDSPHDIDLFMVDSGCNSIATYITSYNYSGSRDQFVLNVSRYLMPRSEIKYNICASSNFSKPDHIQVYIIEGLQQDRDFNPNGDYNDKKVYFKTVGVGANGKTRCTPIRFEVHHPNYYTIRTFIHNKQWITWAHYDLTINEVSIDLNHTENIVSNATLDAGNEQETYHIPFGFNSWCLVAYIHNETVPGFDKHIHTLMKYKLRCKAVLGVTVTLSILLLAGAVVVLSVICCVKCRLFPRIIAKLRTRRSYRTEGRTYFSLST